MACGLMVFNSYHDSAVLSGRQKSGLDADSLSALGEFCRLFKLYGMDVKLEPEMISGSFLLCANAGCDIMRIDVRNKGGKERYADGTADEKSGLCGH